MGDTVGDQSVTTRCANCGTLRDPSDRCPKCGNTPEVLHAEIRRINKAISDMKQRDVQLGSDLKKNSQQLQAAMHQRNLLTNAERERQQKAAPKQRPWSRRPNQSTTAPPGPLPPTRGVPKQPRPPGTTRVAPLAEEQPETSPRLIQNVLLALGPLLLAVTAVIFAVFEQQSGAAPAARLSVLGLVTVGLLIFPSVLVRRGLSATAESLAVVGLALLPVDGWMIAQLPGIEGSMAQTTLFGIIFAVSTAVAFLFHQATALTSARYAMVGFSQPILPLLAYEFVHSPTAWAVVLAIVAAQNAFIARALELFHRPTPTPVTRSNHWLWEISWVLHGLAIGSAAVYALAGLLRAADIGGVSRAALALLLVTGVGVFGALMLRRHPLSEPAAGALTLAVIGSGAWVAVGAIPEQAVLVVSVVVFATGLAVRGLPVESRRGPQLASAAAVTILGVFVVVDVVRAALAPIVAAMPMWKADLVAWHTNLASRTDADWQLVVTVGLLTAAAALALPPTFRREAAVTGALFTALAAPASLGLGWVATIVLLTGAAVALLAVGIGLGSVGVGQSGEGWAVTTDHAATAHMIASVLAGAAALAVALAKPWSTAGVLAIFTVAGVLLAQAQKRLSDLPETVKLGDTATGAAAFAAPGAVCTGLLTLFPGVQTSAALTAGFLAASATLALVAVRLVAHRRIGTPLAIGTGLGALVITGAAFGVDDADLLDAGVGALLLVAAVLLALAPSIDEGRRADRMLDGADIAAAAVTAAAIGSLARAAELYSSQLWLVMAAAAVLVVALGIRMLPEGWRRGPATGAGLAGGVLGLVAGYPALAGGIQAITAPGELWGAALPENAATVPFGWQAPAALLLLAVAAMVALPRPRNYDAAAAAVVLATVGAPAAFGWPWGATIILGLAIATCYAVAATVAVDVRAGYARLAVAVIVALHALAASLAMMWTTAAALAVIGLVSAAVAGLAASIAKMSVVEGGLPPSHLDVVGGTGVLAALLTAPAAVAVYVASTGSPADAAYTATILSIAAGMAILAFWRQPMAPYLGWATVGVALASTIVAIFALLSGRPAGVYAAAAVLLVVLAELLRASVKPLLQDRPARESSRRAWRSSLDPYQGRLWPTHPGSMAAAGAAAPALIAIGSLAPALRAALITPYDNLNAIWQGPPPPLEFKVDGTGVLTALLLTIAAALAAVGFGGGLTRAVSVVVPGIALTILITPVSLGMDWPASAMAAMLVFAVCMLSVALTEPPVLDESTSGVRALRIAVLVIGLIGGGAGLAGALATPGMTIFTFAGAAGVGLAAALGGRQQRARIVGWLGGALAAELLVLCVSLRIGAEPEWAAFAVLAVGTALIAAAALLPRFTRPESVAEASAMEWSGYAAGVIAIALAVESPVHVAGLLAAFGAVLGMTATRPGRTDQQRRTLFWAAAACAIAAWWLMLRSNDVAFEFIEVYSVPFALLALWVGLIELKQRPQLGSWAAYGPALVAGFGPTVVMALANEGPIWREILLLVAGIAVLIFGSQKQQQAPVTIGSIVLTITAFHALTLVDWTWLAVGITGVVLVFLGASSERRRRAMDRYNRYR